MFLILSRLSLLYLFRNYAINSLAPVRCCSDFKNIIFELIMQDSILATHCDIVLMWMAENLTNNLSKLVQVMAWCHQIASHYLINCWPRSLLPCGVTGPQWALHMGTWTKTVEFLHASWFSNAFWISMNGYHCILIWISYRYILRVQWTINHDHQTNVDPVLWCHVVSLGLNITVTL